MLDGVTPQSVIAGAVALSVLVSLVSGAVSVLALSRTALIDPEAVRQMSSSVATNTVRDMSREQAAALDDLELAVKRLGREQAEFLEDADRVLKSVERKRKQAAASEQRVTQSESSGGDEGVAGSELGGPSLVPAPGPLSVDAQLAYARQRLREVG